MKKWTHLNLPAYAEADEVIQLGPDKFHRRAVGALLHPQRFSAEALEEKRQEMGSMAFAAQFQQRPTPAGGAIVRPEWFEYYDPPLKIEPDAVIVQGWDTAWTVDLSASYTVCLTAVYQHHRVYIESVLRERMESPDLIRLIPTIVKRYAGRADRHFVIIEATGVGGSILQQVQRYWLENETAAVYFQRDVPTVDKATRLMKVAPLIENGRVLLPRGNPPWVEPFLREVQQAPKAKYDDQVDALSQVLRYVLSWMPPPPPGMFKSFRERSAGMVASQLEAV
jgi:predicted phage terminase large subunit-like protein